MAQTKHRVLILGGGFAGVYTGMYLEKALRWRRNANVEITIVNRENYIVFQPLLPDVISGAIEILHVVCPIRRLVRKAHLYTREIDHIDLARRRVTLAPGVRPEPLVLEYDHLVIGLGTALDYSKVPGMREHAISFKYLGDALRLRNHLVHLLEEADNERSPDERAKLLTFVVAGGGFSGVECMAELHDFVCHASRAYQNVRVADCRFVLLQSAERTLPEMDERLALKAQQILERRGIEVMLRARLAAVTAQSAVVARKDSAEPLVLPTRTTVATVPAGAHPMISALPCPLERGRIRVDATLAVPGWEGLWAVGDCAAVPQNDGSFSPPTAQHALRQAKVCAANILATLDGRPSTTFDFPGLGKMGSLGRGAAVAEVLGIKLSGILAWLLWRGVYLSKLPGLDRKVRVFTDWVLDLILPRDITQVRIFAPDSIETEHFEPGEVVFEQGNFGDKLYFIAKGEVNIVKDGETVATLNKGDSFGEIALVADQPRGATVQARTALDVVSVSRAAFNRLIAHLPGMKQTIDEIIVRHGGSRPVDDDQPQDVASDA